MNSKLYFYGKKIIFKKIVGVYFSFDNMIYCNVLLIQSLMSM